MPPLLIGPPARRISRIRVAAALFPRINVHFVGFRDLIV
jgi:hypothetical protein